MISKSQIKLITGLNRKKYRDTHGLFVAEGPKVIRELLDEGMTLAGLFTTVPEEWADMQLTEISQEELKKISFLSTPHQSLALFKIPQFQAPHLSGLSVALDALRDPGNLGTIIRLCDWFGIRHLICSLDTADCYNPKVVQASMGSLARVQVHYLDLEDFLKNSSLPVYGGFMDGASVYTEQLPETAILVLGNEANGISAEIESLVTHRISIPRFGNVRKTESLNVATAGAILLNEFRRRHSET